MSIDEIEPRTFSFNNPFGACEVCHGIGYKMEFAEELMIPDPSLSITDGALVVNGWQSVTNKTSYARCVLDALAKEYGFDLDTPYQDLPENIRHMLMHGTDGRSVQVHYRGQRGVGVYDVVFEGIIKNVERRYRETASESTKERV